MSILMDKRFSRPIPSGYVVNGLVSQYSTLKLHPFIPSIPYTLSEEDLPTIKDLQKVLLKLVPRDTESAAQKPFGDLSVALRHFNQAYERDRAEDQIIDLTVALESSLLAGLKDELKYRLALRGAALLVDLWEPQKSQSLLRILYQEVTVFCGSSAQEECNSTC